MGASSFRADIEGLRALAILLVVACHAGVPGLAGGYIGVDVFFVISGFLITRLLLAELADTGRIDILNFYARRIRRLFPALLLVTAATFAVGWFALSPLERPDLARSSAAALGFVSNLYFWRTQDYFAGSGAISPLLHTWTLSVEEQFYLVWPVILLVLGKVLTRDGPARRRVLCGLLAGGSLLSFGLCVLMTFRDPLPAFYLPPTRAWEFGLGGLVAVWPGRALAKPAGGAALSLAGLGLILAAMVLFVPGTPFPGHFAMAPAGGAALLILGGALAPRWALSRALASAPLRLIGRLSYSWYLWHWPALVITRAMAGEVSLGRDLAACVGALGLAAATYVLVERPIRERRYWPGASALRVVAVGLAATFIGAVLCLGAAKLALSHLKQDRGLARIAGVEQARQRELMSCHYIWGKTLLPPGRLPPAAGCFVGAKAGPAVLLWGDSHALHLVPTMDAIGRRSGLRVLHRTKSTCRPFVQGGIEWWNPRDRTSLGCLIFNRLVLKSLTDKPAEREFAAVVLSARWGNSGPGRTWEKDLRSVVIRLRRTGAPVLLAADVVNFPFDAPVCVSSRPEAACSVSVEDAARARSDPNGVLQRLARDIPGVVYWDPAQVQCDAVRCPASRNGVLYYRDYAHLSEAGALALTDALEVALKETLALSAHQDIGEGPGPEVKDQQTPSR